MKINKYLNTIILVNFIFLIIYGLINFNTISKLIKTNQETTLIQNNEILVFDINKKILNLEDNYFKLAIFGINKNTITYYNQQIQENIEQIKTLINLLKNGGSIQKEILINESNKDTLKKIIQIDNKYFDIGLLDVLTKLKLIEKSLKELNEDILNRNDNFNTNLKLKRDLKLLPSIFQRMLENTNRYLLNSEKKLDLLKKEKEEILTNYFLIQTIFVIVMVIINYILLKEIFSNIEVLYNHLEYRLYNDNLTTLKNRVALEEDIEKIKDNKKTLIILDIEKFSNINELYGMAVGNEYLRNFANILLMSEDKGNVYRIGSDEFAILIPDLLDVKKHTKELYQKIMEQKIYIKSIDMSLYIPNLKFGIAVGKNIFENASFALMIAKRKNQLLHFITKKDILEENKKIVDSMYWSNKIKEALKDDKFIPFFQPIVDKDGNIVKYEVLMRLKEGNRIIPQIFLDIAIKNQQYIQLSKMVFLKAVTTFKEKGEFSFNLNYLDIESFEMRNLILNILRANPDLAKRCTFEILEDTEIKDLELLQQFIKETKKLGVSFAIDDFGSGYSNYKRILDLHFDILKIDGSLIKNIETDTNAYNVVKSIVSFAKASNLTTIAEYIHNEQVFKICKSLGIDYFQGFYFSPPKEHL